MRALSGRWRAGSVLAALALVGLAGSVEAQQRGRLRGRVTDRETQQPLAQVQVTLGATTVGALTGDAGTYRIDNVPAGQIEVRARLIGYRVESRTVTVVADQDVTVDFALSAAAIGLDAIVITATGQQQAAREVPHSVPVIPLGDITQTGPIANMADALSARAPGLTVMQSGGTTGGGTRIRIRGSNSVSLSNEPVIFIDGVRVESGSSSNSVGVGGQVPSRINDINPEDIETVEVIKGPSAATLYGTTAANGIVSIRTRRGRAGRTVWRAYAETGTLPEFSDWPNNNFGFDTVQAGGLRFGCTLPRASLGQCTQSGGIVTVNPLRDDPPYRDGSRNQFGLSMAGGNERTTYYMATDFEREFGVWDNNNLERLSLRANINTELSPAVKVAVSTGYVSSDLRLPDNDNNALGYLGSGLLGGCNAGACRGAADTTRRGWGFLLPEESRRIITRQDVERFTGSVTADARPNRYITARATLGLDYTVRFDQRTFPPNQVPFNATTLEGSRAANPVQLFAYTGNVSATGRFPLSRRVVSNTTVGLQYFRDRSIGIFASGRKLAAGTTSLGGIGIPTVNENQAESKTLGIFIEEQVAINDRLYLSAALRQDDNSAFGRDFGGVTYPKLGASWVISEEPFWPRVPMLSSLRLRWAYGQSGLQPGTTDALLFFDAVAVTTDNADQVAFQVGNLGNTQLKPERSREVELGFDAGLARDRMRLEFTYYSKTSRDALIARILAPSLGVTTSQFYNLGEMSNRGVEITLSGRPVDRPNVSLDLSLSAWGNRNRVVELGQDFLGNQIPDIVFGVQRHREGFPAGAYFVRPITSVNDANADNRIVSAEVVLDTAFRYAGTPFPTQGYTLASTLTLFRRLAVSATLDQRGGHSIYNLTADFRCRQNICSELVDPATPIARQAEAVSTVFQGQPNGYIEDASFLKLRELSITYYAPDAWARRVGATGMSLTFAGRNLGLWTGYTGFDPEINESGQANFGTRDFLTQPPVRYYTARVNLTF